MGLNDLTLEKLIGEINGYKEKMRSIYEDYGRASQELQDRINVLGYNLNEHLKETKDRIASTPQRLLNLETKYVAGEVNDGEYRQQREEFKALLERNLHSIEEIRSMITVLSHIEALPLTPAEFKHVAAANVKAPTAEEPRTVIAQPSPVYVSTPPALTGLRFPETYAAKAPVESPASKFTPSPPQPESNGTNWTNPNPQPTNAPEIAPPPPAVEATTLAASVPAAPVVETQPAPYVAPAPETATTTPSLETATVSAEDSNIDVPSVDIVESSGADDALMVKVVDDIPALEASAAVVSPDTSQIQPVTAGPEAAPGVPSVAPDVAQLSLTPPTQFYKVVCPKCGAEVPKPVKVWELKGGKSKKNVLIGLFQCQDCRVKFREALTREIL